MRKQADQLPRLFVVGDSISLHYGPHLKQMLSGVLICASWPGDDGAPIGGNGGDSFAALKALADAANGGFQPEWVLVNCGLHDIKTNPATGEKQVPLEQYRRNLREIVACAEQMSRVVWVRTTPLDDMRHNSQVSEFHRFAADVDAYNAAADAIMNESSVPSVDLYGFTRSLGPEVFCDHVHFTEPVRQMQAAFIAGYLSRVLSDPIS